MGTYLIWNSPINLAFDVEQIARSDFFAFFTSSGHPINHTKSLPKFGHGKASNRPKMAKKEKKCVKIEVFLNILDKKFN